MIPQLLIVALGMIGLGIHAGKHGKPMTAEHNFWHKCIAISISWTILYYGGFWDCFIK